MRVLFVENQYKTYFFEAIALKLKEKGYTVSWIVQNKVFTPKSDFKKYIIPYPKKKDYSKEGDVNLDDVIYSDRNINYFRQSNKGYFYYYFDQIKSIIDDFRPDVVFGESAVFHELLTGKYCKYLGIKYLNPLPCRYPTGRFSFYLYDTLEPYKGSGELLSREKVVSIIDNIVHRKISPDYMKPLEMNKYERVANRLKKTLGYYVGDKFNTPSPRIKLTIEREKLRFKNEWDNLSFQTVQQERAFKVLYPLQVQPEENIDVWGRKRRDQLLVIKDIAANLTDDAVLYVKPNPKPKYEVDSDMISYIKDHPKIKMLDHSVSMTDVFNDFDLIITVTGTIAIESILSNKPVVNLIKGLINSVDNCMYLEQLSELPKIIGKVKNNTFPKATLDEKIAFINLLNSTSYEGNVSDILSDKNCVEEQNIETVTKAFIEIMNDLKE